MVNARFVIKPMAVVQAVAMLEAVVREVVAVVEDKRVVVPVEEEVVGPDTKAANTVTGDTKMPVVHTMTVAERSMAMGVYPVVMGTAPMNATGEPSPGRRVPRQGKHQGDQEKSHRYHV